MQITSQATEIYNNVNDTYPLFVGGCLFEYNDELWKTGGFGNDEEQSFGLNAFSGTSETDLTTTKLTYLIDELRQKQAYADFQTTLAMFWRCI